MRTLRWELATRASTYLMQVLADWCPFASCLTPLRDPAQPKDAAGLRGREDEGTLVQAALDDGDRSTMCSPPCVLTYAQDMMPAQPSCMHCSLESAALTSYVSGMGLVHWHELTVRRFLPT